MTQTRKQFELMKPEMFRKIKRLYDGEEFDLDAAIDYVVERKAGHSCDDKIYWRRNKIERDVAVAFLLDMSASTDEEINRRERKYTDDDDFDDDPRRYLLVGAEAARENCRTRPSGSSTSRRRAPCCSSKALETIGDSYGIYGFSGYGRDNVEFYVIKDLDEQFNDKIKQAHRQGLADPQHAHGPGDPPRHREARPVRRQGEDPLPRLRWPAAGPRLRPRPHREGVRHPRHEDGAERGQAQGHRALRAHRRPRRPRLPRKRCAKTSATRSSPTSNRSPAGCRRSIAS